MKEKTVKKEKVSKKGTVKQPVAQRQYLPMPPKPPQHEMMVVGAGGMEALKNFDGANRSASAGVKAAINMLKQDDVPTISVDEAKKLSEYLDGLRQEFGKRLDELVPLMVEGIAENVDTDIRRACSKVEEVINKMSSDELRKKLGTAWVKLFAEKMPANKTAKAYLARTAIAVGVAKLAPKEGGPSAIKLPVNENGRWSSSYFTIEDQSLLYLIRNVFNQIFQNEKDAEYKKISEGKEGTIPFLAAIENNSGVSIVSIPNDAVHGGGLMKVSVANGQITVVEGYYGMAGLAQKLVARRIAVAVSDVISGNLEKRVQQEIFGLTIAAIKTLHRGYISDRDKQKHGKEMEAKVTVGLKQWLGFKNAPGPSGIAMARLYRPWSTKDGKTYKGVKFLVERNDKGEVRVLDPSHLELFKDFMEFQPENQVRAKYPLGAMLDTLWFAVHNPKR